MSEDIDVFVPTRASLLNRKSEEEFTSTIYRSYKKKNAVLPTVPKKESKLEKFKETQPESFNIKKVKHEVFKLGISRFETKMKQAAKIELAIKLGAKPPKNIGKNYKELLEEKKKEKLEQKSVQDLQQLGKNQFGKSIAKGKGFDRKRRKEKTDLLEGYGTVKKLKGKSRK